MDEFTSLIVVIGIVLVALYIIALPVKLAGMVVGARRTGVFWCLLALILASVMHSIGLVVPCIGSIVAFLLSAVAFAVIMGTGFLGGIVIAVLHVVIAVALAAVVSLVFGVSLWEAIPAFSGF